MRQLEWVIYEAIHAYGLPQMAERLRISPQMLVNKINPKHAAHNLTLDQLLVILEATQASQIVAALQERARLQHQAGGNLIAMTPPSINKTSGDATIFEEHTSYEKWTQDDAKTLEDAANEAVHAIGEAVSASWALARRKTCDASMPARNGCPSPACTSDWSEPPCMTETLESSFCAWVDPLNPSAA